MFKKHMTPLSKGGQLVAHKGKGSQQAGMPSRHQIGGMAGGAGPSMNDYAKASPMGLPTPGQSPGMAGGAPGVGPGEDGDGI